jgi:protein-tyrosine phosphatase
MISVMFVCLGNICRSPAAEGILFHQAKSSSPPLELHVESSAIGGWHSGQLPDHRMRAAIQSRGIELVSRAQQIDVTDFDRFDYVLAADNEILMDLHSLTSRLEHKAKIFLITEFSGAYKGEEVPDPYFGGEAGFEYVLDMLEDSCAGLIEHLQKAK